MIVIGYNAIVSPNWNDSLGVAVHHLHPGNLHAFLDRERIPIRWPKLARGPDIT